MKKITMMLALITFIGMQAIFAQSTVTGTVTDDAGAPVPGATVIPQGQPQAGTLTNADGTYSVDVPAGVENLTFTFVGLQSQTVAINGQTVLNVVLNAGDVVLDEFVITALGISREKKSLGYAVQEVDGDAVNTVKSDNFVNSLSGKVAGVHVKANNNMGGSTNIVIRGSTSLTGNNQAMFVIDGVPISNYNTNTSAQQQGSSGYDFGSAVSDINPDDIESISVLKGAAATALYGSRAANGVILITTKKGNADKGLGVELSSSVTVGIVDKSTFPTYQTNYGAGYGPYYSGGAHPFLSEDADGNLYTPFTEDGSVGAKFDENLMVYQWDAMVPEHRNFGKATPWTNTENGAITFFNNSNVLKNSVAISGNNGTGSMRLSYTNLHQTGILPNSELDRNNLTFSGSQKLADKLTVSASASYANTETTGRNETGYSNNLMSMYRQWWQTNVDVQELKDMYETTGRNVTWNRHSASSAAPEYWDNMYWVRYENYVTDERNRLLGNFAVTYEITDYLNIVGRASVDYYSTIQEERLAQGSIAKRFGISRLDVGSGYSRYDMTFRENNYDVMLNFSKQLTDDLSLTALLGSNVRRTFVNSTFSSTNGGLVIADLYALSNSVNSPLATVESAQKIGVNGIYGSLSLGYQDFVYLDATIRRDESSTLPEENSAFFYPSVATSFIFSKFITADWLQFGKVRLNYAEVGNSAPFASISDTYAKPSPFGSTALFSVSSTKNNKTLKPERTKSMEAGLNVVFFDKRLSVDMAVYQTNTIDQIMPVSVTAATGYTSKYVNAGEIENKGFELALTGTPVIAGDLKWDLSVNWTKNTNKVISLFEGVDNLQLGSFQGGITINARKGEPYGTIQGSDFVYTNGEKTIDSNGYYMKTSTTDEIIGNINPDWNAGISNRVTYKNFAFSFLIDIQKGGDIFSLDHWYGEGTGLYAKTDFTNDLGNPVRNSISDGGGFIYPGVQEDGTTNNVRIQANNYKAFGWKYSPNSRYVYDASYVKLREVTLSYNLPSGLLSKTFIQSAKLSFVGSNLWIIFKNLPDADPEAGLSAGNLQGFQSGVLPTTRNFGFSVNLKF